MLWGIRPTLLQRFFMDSGQDEQSRSPSALAMDSASRYERDALNSTVTKCESNVVSRFDI